MYTRHAGQGPSLLDHTTVNLTAAGKQLRAECKKSARETKLELKLISTYSSFSKKAGSNGLIITHT